MYRYALIVHFPKLREIDELEISEDEKNQAEVKSQPPIEGALILLQGHMRRVLYTDRGHDFEV